MYYVIETQTYKDEHGDLSGATIVTTQQTRNEAESDYHRILSVAATSDVYIHGAIVLTADCVPILTKAYTHEPEAAY